MKLIIISSPEFINKEATLITSMLEQGLNYFHLRKPSSTIQQMKELLKKIPDQWHSKIVIHSHYELMSHFNLKGIHWTARSRQSPDKEGGTPISTSFHNLEELQGADKAYEYCFLSPIYDSISKADYPSKFTKKVVQSALLKVPLKVIALGGITPDKITECSALGFEGVATLGAIWQSENPLKMFDEFQTRINVKHD